MTLIKIQRISYAVSALSFLACIIFLLVYIGEPSVGPVLYSFSALVCGAISTYLIEKLGHWPPINKNMDVDGGFMKLMLLYIKIPVFAMTLIIVLSIFSTDMIKHWSWLIIVLGLITGQKLAFFYSIKES